MLLQTNWLLHSIQVLFQNLVRLPMAGSNCTKVCVYMSIVLLVSSLIYEFTGFAYADVIGTAGLIYFSMTEGKEAFEKAKGKDCDCC